MKSNREFLVIESLTGEGPVVLIPDKSPTRKRRFGTYRAAMLRPARKWRTQERLAK